MWILLLFAVALSIDSFTVGFTYGLRKIKIPINSLLILLLCSATVIYTSVTVGKIISQFISPTVCKVIGGLILIGLGAWMLFQSSKDDTDGSNISDASSEVFSLEIKALGIMIQILKTPTLADFDNSGNIAGLEAFMLGFALSIDSFGAGIGMSVLGFNPVIITIFVSVMSALFLKTGALLGAKCSHLDWIQKFTKLPGLLLIIIGFWRI